MKIDEENNAPGQSILRKKLPKSNNKRATSLAGGKDEARRRRIAATKTVIGKGKYQDIREMW